MTAPVKSIPIPGPNPPSSRSDQPVEIPGPNQPELRSYSADEIRQMAGVTDNAVVRKVNEGDPNKDVYVITIPDANPGICRDNYFSKGPLCKPKGPEAHIRTVVVNVGGNIEVHKDGKGARASLETYLTGRWTNLDNISTSVSEEGRFYGLPEDTGEPKESSPWDLPEDTGEPKESSPWDLPKEAAD